MNPTLVISDCLPGYHHPPGDTVTCVPNNPPQDIPTMDVWGMLALVAALSAVALLVGVKRLGWWE